MIDTITEDQELKQCAIDMLRRRYAAQRDQIVSIEPRLAEYYEHLCAHSSAVRDDTDDLHNCSELLCALKLLRLLRTYIVDRMMIRDVIYRYEGEWKQEGKKWVHVTGGVKHPGNHGDAYYRLQPFQVFVLVAMFGPMAWVNTWNEAGTRDLLPTEKEHDGVIYDLRRLCTEFTLYTPRKTSKTQLSAFIQFFFFMSGDDNAECYCCANAAAQANILFTRTKNLIRQMDSKERRIRFTDSQVNWKDGQFRSASLTALSAGGKTKDGLIAQLCSADEFGSASYVNGVSDMGRLVSVIESSMGPRREPMTFISTTAGVIQNGPFIVKLEGIESELKRETGYNLSPVEGFPILKDTADRHMALLLQPDKWERDPEYLFSHPHIRRKVNPMLGIVVQHSFYDDEIHKARTDGIEKLQDVVAKDFNVYMSGRTERWIAPEKIRDLQTDMTIDQCVASGGWVVFCGMDFSQGDDLHTTCYLAVRRNPVTLGYEFFADVDAWIKEDTLRKSSIADLYRPWIEKGWLKVSRGEVFQPSLPVVRIKQLWDAGVQFGAFGYDSYRSKDPINMLIAFLSEQGVRKPEIYVRSVSQTNASYNPAVDQVSYCIKCDDPLIRFSANPLWPWCFGNAVLEYDRMENAKPKKQNPGSDSCKVDPVQCLCTAFILESQFEGTSHNG